MHQFRGETILMLMFCRVTSGLEKMPNFSNSSQMLPKSLYTKKCQNICSKGKNESSKYLLQTTFETFKYLHKTCFKCAYLGENVINLLKQKRPKCHHYFWLLILFKKS